MHRSFSNTYSISGRTAVRAARLCGIVVRRTPGACPLPASEQSVGHLLRGEREHEMVAPGAVDVEITRPQSLLAESEFLDDPTAGPVLRANADLDAVQADRAATMVHDKRHRGRHHSAPGHRLVHPVTDVTRAHRAPGDSGDRQLPDQLPPVLDDERQHPPRVRLGPEVADHLTVGRPVRDRPARGGRRNGRLPGAQPVPVAPVDLTPEPLVTHLYRPQDDIAVRQYDGPGRA